MTPEYDQALKRLEEIIRELELKDDDLATALALYAEGKQLVEQCQRILNGDTEQPLLRCPYVECDKPLTVVQTSFGGNYEDFACDNAHDFGIVRHRIDPEDEFEEEPHELES